MATSLSGQIRNQISLTFDGGSEIGTTSDDVLGAANYFSWAVTDGTAANKADLVFRDQRSLNASTSEDLDLAGGLTSAYGAAITFVKVKMLYVKAKSTNGANIVVGGAAANQFINWVGDATDKVVIPPSGCLMVAAPIDGWAVTANTGDILKIENTDGAAAATYDIIIVGTSA